MATNNFRNLFLGVVCLSCLLLVGKKILLQSQDADVVVEESAIEKSLPSDFIDFYEQFQSDSLFQISHILEPIKVYDYTDSLGAIEYMLPLKDWVLHRPFDSQGNTFERVFEVVSDQLIVEQIFNAQYGFDMKRRYAKMNGEWMLIYYKKMTPVQ